VSTITLEGLTKVYATGVKALDGLDLHIDDGEFVVLVGPSGCGKTTALRMVAGLEQITSGTVRFGDQVVNGISPRYRDIAMVFQNYALYPHLTVAENIGFALKNKKIPKPERDVRIRSAAAVLGLSEFLNRRPAQLSGGQRQRVAMGRAIVRDPSVFLMDEPLSNLDARLRVQMRSEILRVHKRIGAATLYVTHDQTEAMTMGDRVAVLRAGLLQQYGPPRELYDNPANLFVASFLGSPAMNLYEASLDTASLDTVERTASVALGSQRLALPAAVLRERPDLAAYHGRKIIVGIRPESLTSVPAADDQGAGPADGGTANDVPASRSTASGTAAATLTVDVKLVEALGSEHLVYFSVDAPRVRGDDEVQAGDQVAEGEIIATGTPNGTARVDPRSAIKPGTRVTFAVHTTRLHFFDPDTHLAIGR
jgi:multiple sugar transport system ATP-binding protein